MFPRIRSFLVLAIVLAGASHASATGSLREDMNRWERSLNVLCQIDNYIPLPLPANEFSNSTMQREYNANSLELADIYGYEAELHEVTTDDGYVLTHFRIPGRKGLLHPGENIPILLVHGFLENSDHWMLLGAKSFAFMLADEGYDVWMANMRGTTYSKDHKILSVDNPEFWHFTWHELGVHDIPATIDYILQKTGKEKLFYIGYSTGTTSFFVMMSEKPEYNEKIAAAVALAPIVFWNHIGVLPRAVIFELGEMAYRFAESNKHIPILSLGGFLLQCAKRVCRTPLLSEKLCEPILGGVFGYNTDEEDKYRLPIFTNHFSSGSLQQVVHFSQVGNYGSFQKYKYSSNITNMLKYGSPNPPRYELANVKVPLILFTANKDPLGNELNIIDLRAELRTEVIHEIVKDENFDHMSFTWGQQAPTVLYPRVISLLKRYHRQIIL